MHLHRQPSARSSRRDGLVEFGGREPPTRLKPLSHPTAQLLSDLGSSLENWPKVRFREFIHGGGSQRGNICGRTFACQKSHLAKVIAWSEPQPFFLPTIVRPRDRQNATPESLLQNSSNAANFPCVRGGGAAGAQAGAGLSWVTRSI